MNSRPKYTGLLLCVLLLFATAAARAQGPGAADTITATIAPAVPGSAPRPDAAVWDSLTRDKAFFYRNTTEQAKKIPGKTQPGAVQRFLERLIVFFISTAGQILFWAVVLLILGYVLYRVLRGEVSFIWGRKEKRKDTSTDAAAQLSEEDLLSSDWQHRMQLAAAHQDRRQATRYALLHILQRLQSAGLIQYRMDKTNYAYYLELQQTELRDLFRRLVLAYELTWFGRFALSDADWTAIQQLYGQLKTKVNA